MRYYYAIEMFKDNEWVKEVRIYHIKKDLLAFDLHDIQGKRRNAKFINL